MSLHFNTASISIERRHRFRRQLTELGLQITALNYNAAIGLEGSHQARAKYDACWLHAWLHNTEGEAPAVGVQALELSRISVCFAARARAAPSF